MRALIVDDSQTNVNLLRLLLAQLDDCEPVTFTDPVAALDSMPDAPPDVVVVDYMMPRLDGIEFIKQMRLNHHFTEIPVIMVTTNDERSVRHKALDVGATDFLLKPIDAVELRSRVKNLLGLWTANKKLRERAARLSSDVVSREEEIILRLARAAEYRDTDTGAHILRMASYCEIIAQSLSLNPLIRSNLYLASQMHDVGKIGVADTILLKPGPLTFEERKSMELHTIYGYRILLGSQSDLVQEAAQIARSHHEKWNGTGYPDGLAGNQIPLTSRIAAVADVLDALTSPRPYKQAWSLEDARRYLVENRGVHFDPLCVDALIARWGEVLRIAADSGPRTSDA